MKNLFLSAVLLTSLFVTSASANQVKTESEFVSVSAGFNDVLRSNKTGIFSGEYHSEGIFQNFFDKYSPTPLVARPMAGLSVTSDSSKYLYGGISFDIPLSERWALTPHLVAGLYSKGAGRDLGGAFEFREGIGADYFLLNGSRLGFSFNHISNAFIYDENPGEESLLFHYKHPVNFLNN
jgi:hypothetical protein